MREARSLLAAAALVTTAAAGQGLPAKNLGFEAWDAGGRPEGWRVQSSEHYAVAADCAGARNGGCALRIESRPTAARGLFVPLAQPLGAGPAAGHRLKLSGWIRTARVEDGWAGLWMRADVEGKTMVLENMHREGPRGDTAWSPFAIAIDVPANATLVSFGVLLSGRGTAWFDDLELAVDTSVTVGRALKSEAIFPPRPLASNGLAPEESLRLPPSEAPRAKPAWRDEARAAAHPIRSLWSDDFSDLAFLKPLLAGKRVVQLGESAHGVAEFNWMKVRLVKFLHREMGFDVVAFESSLSGCDVADARVGSAAPIDVMRDAIFPVWHSSETLGLFEYLDAERAAGRRISLAGFDVQNSGRARSEVARGLVRQLDRVDAALARRIEAYEGRLARGLDAAAAAEMKAAYTTAAERLAAERQALRALESQRPVVVDLAIQELRSRARYVEQLAQPGGGAVRDLGMAENLDFLLDTLYPGRKVIVWAHNAHIARQPVGSERERWMGSWVAERRAAEVYTVGFYMGWGIAATNDRRRYEVKRAADDSLEAILANAGWRMAFVDLARGAADPGSWTRAPLDAREWGVNPVRVTPARAFDGLIYIDAVTPPEYL